MIIVCLEKMIIEIYFGKSFSVAEGLFSSLPYTTWRNGSTALCLPPLAGDQSTVALPWRERALIAFIRATDAWRGSSGRIEPQKGIDRWPS